MLLPMQMPGLNEEQIVAADSLMKAKTTERMEVFSKMTWEERFQTVGHNMLDFGIKLLVVLVIFFVGRWLIGRLVKMLDRIFERRKVDPSLRTFVKSLIKIALYCILFYIIIAYLGVNTSLFVALFAAAGLAIGMALSGVFQNFAGGVMILLLKPFKVGDWVEVQEESGTVTDIRLFNTILQTADNKTILLPNGSVSTSVITNYNTARTRRVDWKVSLEYGTDFEAVRKVLTDLIQAETRILPAPEPIVALGGLGPSSVDVTVRGWVKSPDYWDVYFAVNAAIYKTLPERGFHFPYSTMDVNIRNIPESGHKK